MTASTPEATEDAAMNKLLECTKGKWRLDPVPNRAFAVRADHHGAISAISYNGPNPDRNAQQRANAALIAAAFDHALIGWALAWLRGDMWHTFNSAALGEMGFQPNGHSNEIFWLPADPFGFPILTDDLRARLIAEMEAAK